MVLNVRLHTKKFAYTHTPLFKIVFEKARMKVTERNHADSVAVFQLKIQTKTF